MGRGNVCVNGKYEGLYYIDRDYTDVYCRKYDHDIYEEECLSELDYADIANGDWEYEYSMIDDYIEEFIHSFVKRYKAFSRPCKKTYVGDGIVILESKLFYIVLEDNQWSYAVKLIQKSGIYDEYMFENLQRKHHVTYLAGIRNTLLDIFPEIGTYKGAWTHGTIKRGEV